MKVLISGASVAGPALAYWLGRNGCDVTVVERAPQLRQGGYAVDFRGPAHLSTLARMGVLADLEAVQTHGGAMRFINPAGRTRLFLPAEFAGGELEVRRADLSRILSDHCGENVRFRFGDSITALVQHPARVEVAFAQGAPETYDFAFGADGIHSNVRRLAFPGADFERPLGYGIASWDAPGLAAPEGETLCCNVPGRMLGIQPAGRHGASAGVWAMFVAPKAEIDRRDAAGQHRLLHGLFAGMGWRAAELLATLEGADDLYFNTLSRALVPTWSAGRVALVGDASGGTSIGGMGTGSAIVGAYVLAGELLATPGDHQGAFRRYQDRVAPYAEASSVNGESSGRFIAPATATGLWARDALMACPPIKAWMIREAGRTGAAIALPDYPI
jgi:2-polyprenyl-6-methoxyphenol hydroxylase-like FAD-dependent oxidoreductase